MSSYQDYNWTNAIPPSTNYLLPQLKRLLSKSNNKSILDVGCGNGVYTRLLYEQGYNIYGIDASETGIEIANQSLPGRVFVQNVESNELPNQLQNLKFDTVISTEVVEHLYDPHQYIDFCKKALARSGQLIVSTPYHGYPKNLALAIAGKLDTHYHPLRVGGHIKFWSKETLSSLLKEHNFEVTNFLGCGRFPYLWKSMMVKAEVKE